MSFRELQEWSLFFNQYPPEAEIVDEQFSTLLFVVASALGVKGVARKDWSLLERLRPVSKEEASARIRALFGIEG